MRAPTSGRLARSNSRSISASVGSPAAVVIRPSMSLQESHWGQAFELRSHLPPDLPGTGRMLMQRRGGGGGGGGACI